MATDQNSGEFEVERILADDVVEGQTFYLVKWQGYPDEECTWEPLESFTSKTSIDEWERQKAAGLGLPDEFLVMLQQRMDDFRARQQDDQSQSDASETSDSEDVEANLTKPKQNQSTPLIQDKIQQQVQPPKSHDSPRRKGTAVAVKKSHQAKVPAQPPRLQTSSTAKPTVRSRKPPASKDAKVKPKASMAGQRFRNLSHMNNYRKKARAEPAPNVPASQLRSAADFANGPDTAHVLPSTVATSSKRLESPLFIPDTSVGLHNTPPSPTLSDDSVFPPTRAAHTLKTISPTNAVIQPQPSRHIDETPHIASAHLNDSAQIVTAKNGRWWYRGDIVCRFTMDHIIGDARLVYVPHTPYGFLLIKLKEGPYLTINFHSKPLTRPEFEAAFSNFGTPLLALGLIDPFEDQRHAFDEFAQYLEDYDAAGLFHHPEANMSLILYSCDARSWADFGRLPARSGSSRAKLHVGFVTKLIARPAEQDLSMTEAGSAQPFQPTDAQTPGISADAPSSLLHPQQANPLSGQSTGLPSIAHGVSELAILTRSPSNSADDMIDTDNSPTKTSSFNWKSRSTSPTASTPMSPSKPLFIGADGLPRKASSTIPIDDHVERTAKHPAQTIKPGRSTKLTFNLLVTPLDPGLKLDKNNPIFFISFSRSHPKEARMIQDWVERYTASSNIYIESERHDWARFCDQVESRTSVVLFHGDNLNFQQLPKLRLVLASPKPAFFSLTFGGDSLSDLSLSSTVAKRLFPSAAMYLITESTILHHPEHALEVLRYFNKTKKPNYRMVMRPNIERWLLSRAASEQHEKRRHTLLDIVVLIRNLGVMLAGPLSTEVEDARLSSCSVFEGVDDSSRYIISCDGLPGYSDVELPALAPDEIDKGVPPKPRLSLEQRDDLLQTYYFYYSAARAHKFRRFLIVLPSIEYATVEQKLNQKIAENRLDCGHIMFHDVEKFVDRFCRERERKKPGNTTK